MRQHAFWPFIRREILKKTSNCKPCVDIGKNLRSIVTAYQWKQRVNCSEPNEEFQIDVGELITNSKDQDTCALACIDRLSIHATFELHNK